MSTNHHRRHDIADVVAVHRGALSARDWYAVPPICPRAISTFAELSVVAMWRERELGPSWPGVEADVVIWAVGEAKSRVTTRVGGKPYWPAERPWPTYGDVPMMFVGQLAVVDSRDLIEGDVGDVLLLFADVDNVSERGTWYSGSGVVALYSQELCDARLVESMPISNHVLVPLVGDLVRYWDTSCLDLGMELGIDVGESSDVFDPGYWRYRLAVACSRLFATKVGGMPVGPQSEVGAPECGRCFGMFASLTDSVGKQLEAAVRSHRNEYGSGGLLEFSDSGAFILGLDEAGEIKYEFDCE